MLTIRKLVRALYERTPYTGNQIVLPEFRCSPGLGLLYDLAAHVPPLLQAFDSLSNKSDPALLYSLDILQQELETWLTSAFRSEQRNGTSPLEAERVGLEYSFQPYGTRVPLWSLTRESLCRICLLLVAECVDTLLSRNSTIPHPAFAAKTRAVQLKSTIRSLARASEIPASIAKGVSAPLHFLARYYAQTGDSAGLKWCADFKNDILKSAPYLRWDVLLPWFLQTVHELPMH